MFDNKQLQSNKCQFLFSWCGPCHELAPRLEAATEKAGFDLVKVDVDDHSELAMEYDVSSIPAVIAVREGKLIEKFIGAQDDNEIKKFIQKLVNCTM